MTGWKQLAEQKTEPNSRLGKAIRYMLRHWMPLTLFLREPGAPIDNNIVEKILGSIAESVGNSAATD